MLLVNNRNRIIGQRIALFMVLGTIIWMLLLVISATKIRTSASNTYEVRLGPLLLNKITRKQSHHDYIATISLEKGLFGYYLLWLALGTIAGTISPKEKRD